MADEKQIGAGDETLSPVAEAWTKALGGEHTETEVGSEALQEVAIDFNSEEVAGKLAEALRQGEIFIKVGRVSARPVEPGEVIVTMTGNGSEVTGADGTDGRIAKEGEWVVSNVDAHGERQLVDDKTFQKRYESAATGERGDDGNPIYISKGVVTGRLVHEVLSNVDENTEVTGTPPNWGGYSQSEKGDAQLVEVIFSGEKGIYLTHDRYMIERAAWYPQATAEK